MQGIFPSRDSGFVSGDTLGFIYNFAGTFAPGGSMSAAGQLLPIQQNTAVFSLLGTNYGGDGRTNFAVPNLAGRAIIGDGFAPGLSQRTIGETTGSANVALALAQLPAHTHSLSGGQFSGQTGGNQPYDNMQPSLALTRVIAIEGIYPSQGGGGNGSAFLGQVATFGGNFAPGGWMRADGQLLPIDQYSALFSLIGTTYGGNGVTTFALPDLRGRVSVGANGNQTLGTTFGQESTALTSAQMPAHNHALPGGVATGNAGGNTPVNNVQPSLALNYLIALNGIYPSRDGGGFSETDPTLGQIVEFAGNFAPRGWALADGRLLPIAQNQALFSLLGTQYGGDGRTTFALPDLRGRTLIGTGNTFQAGDMIGTDSTTLSIANLPAHTHTAPVPEPETYAVLLAGLGLLGVVAQRRKRQAVA